MSYNLWTDCKKAPITELLSFIVDNRGKTVPTAPNGHKLIATNCVTNNTLFPVYEKIRYLSEETYQTWFRAHPIPGDILFVNKGTPGRVCLVPDPIDFCIAQDMIALRADETKIYPKFLFAVLRSREIQQQIYNTNVGDVIPHFKKQFMDQLLIPVPDRAVQEAIGDLYYSLSFKAEQNKKINDNLLAQAQAIFMQRFIMDEIEGDEKALYDFADYINGAAFKPSECGDHGLPIIKIAELKNGITDSTKWFDGFKGEKYLIQDKDILFSWSGNPDTSIDIFIWTHGKAILNQHTFNVKSNTGHRWFIFLMLKYFKPEFSRIASNKQTTGLGHVTITDLKRLTFLFNEDVIEAFEHEVSPFMETIYSNMMENQRLEQLRDNLLPKLMSGEIDVSNIQL